MIEVKEFLNYLCNAHEFRFLTGIESKKLNLFYNNLDADLLHYIPAITPNTAIDMVNGVYLGGVKAAAILDEDSFELIKDKLILPVLIIIIAKSIDYKPKGVKSYKIIKNVKNELNRAVSYVNKNRKPCLVLLDESTLS